MTKKVLKKTLTSFLDQPFAENILPSSLFSKKVKKLIGKMGNNTEVQLSKSDKIRKAETHILKQFSKFSCSGKSLFNSPFLVQHTKGAYEDPTIVALLGKQGARQSTLADPPLVPHVLFSIDQIRNEIVSRRIQTKTYSEFKSQLREIKKIRILYGNISKRDLAKTIARMKTFTSTAGENLLLILETRLDVALQRCGFFANIQTSRQSIIHGKIKVNFKYVTFPGYLLKAGDIVKVTNKRLKSSQPHTGAGSNPLQNSMIWAKRISIPGIEKDEYKDFNTSKCIPISNPINNKGSLSETELLEKNTSVLNNQVTKQHLNTLSLEKVSRNMPLLGEIPNLNTNEWRFSVSPRMLYSLLQLQSHVLYSKYHEAALANQSISVNEFSTLFDNKHHRQKHVETLSSTAEKQHLNTFDNSFSNPEIGWPLSFCKHVLPSFFHKTYALKLESGSTLDFSLTQNQIYSKKSALLAHHLRQSYYLKRGLLPTHFRNPFRGPGSALAKLCCNTSQQSFVHIFNTITQYILLKKQHMGIRTENKKGMCSLSHEKVFCLACALHKIVYYGVLARQGIQKDDSTKFVSKKTNEQYSKQQISTDVFDCKGEQKHSLMKDASLLVSCFWLLVKKFFTPYTLQKQVYSLHKHNTFFRHQRSLSQKTTKPLHLEVSYQSRCAVFLYSPQRIYLPAVVDLGLITKAFKKT